MMLVCQQLVQATGEEYQYEQTDIMVKCQGHDFTARGKVPVQMGFKAAGNAFKNQCVKAKPEEETEKETSIPYGYEEGMTLSPVKAEKTVHFTSPPKPFNEDTLLAAMETAGNKDFDSETEKKGLGTPASRAGIIEKLVSSGYAVRKGKQILLLMLRLYKLNAHDVQLMAKCNNGEISREEAESQMINQY